MTTPLDVPTAAGAAVTAAEDAAMTAPLTAPKQAREHDANDDDNNNCDPRTSSSLTSSITFQDTLMDLGSWWCHAVLLSSSSSSSSWPTTSSSNDGSNVVALMDRLRVSSRLLKELEHLLHVLEPVDVDAPIYSRLHCLVIWHEFLKQMLLLDGTAKNNDDSNNNDDNDKHDDHGDEDGTDPTDDIVFVHDDNDIGKRNFDTLLGRLQVAHRTFFSKTTKTKTTTTIQTKYEHVLMLVRVHGILSCLYRALAPEHAATMSHQDLCVILDDCSDDWDTIFGGSGNGSSKDQNNDGDIGDGNGDDGKVEDGGRGVPTVLADIVDKGRPGLAPDIVRRRIEDAVWGRSDDVGPTANVDDQPFSYAELHHQLQTLLLDWCELGVDGVAYNLPELVRLGYRGLGVVHREVEQQRVGEPDGRGGRAASDVTAATFDKATNTTMMDRREVSARDIVDNSSSRSSNDADDDDDRTEHLPGIVRKRKRRRPLLSSIAGDEEEDLDERAYLHERTRRTQNHSKEFPNDDVLSSAASASDDEDSEVRLRREWPEDFADSESQQEDEERDELEMIRQERRRRSHSPSKAELQRAAARLLGRIKQGRPRMGSPSSSSSPSLSSPSSSSLSSRNKRSMVPVSFPRVRRHRAAPVPVQRGDFMTPPEDFEDVTTNRYNKTSHRATLGGRTRKRIRWEEDEDKALQEGVEKHGFGNWAAIKDDYPLRLSRRTNRDLKDRARNIQNQGLLSV